MGPSAHTSKYLAETRQTSVRTLNIGIIIFALGFVVLRIFVRRRWGTGLALDDWMILGSTVFFLIVAGLNLLMIEHGVGLHLAAVTEADFSVVLQGLVASECAYTLTVALTKISILLMYCHIFPLQSMKRGAFILGGITVLWAIAVFSVSIFQCTPIRKAWLPTIDGHCINIKAYFIGNSLPNILTDIAILTLPMPQVWKLQTIVSRKISLSVVFLLGIFVVAASIYRLITLLQFDASDFTWTTAAPCAWSVVEVAAALVSACLPTLGPALRVLQLKLGIQTGSSQSQRRMGGGSNPVDLVTIGGTRRRRTPGQGGQHWTRSESENFKRLEDNVSPDRDRDFTNADKLKISNISVSKQSKASERDDGSGDEMPLNIMV